MLAIGGFLVWSARLALIAGPKMWALCGLTNRDAIVYTVLLIAAFMGVQYIERHAKRNGGGW